MEKNEESGWFDVRAYSTQERWEGPEQEDSGLDGLEQLQDAIDHAKDPMYADCWQVVVVACGNHAEYESGETVFFLKEEHRDTYQDKPFDKDNATNAERLVYAEKLAEKHLIECCQEILELQSEGILKDGKVREIARICDFAGHSALSIAETLVYKASMRKVIADSQPVSERKTGRGIRP